MIFLYIILASLIYIQTILSKIILKAFVTVPVTGFKFAKVTPIVYFGHGNGYGNGDD